jgi:hypothetical protein
VYGRYEHEGTPGEKLTEFPVIGFLFTPFVTRQADFDEAELRKAMIDEIDSRVRSVRSEFIEKVPGWSAARLSTLELFLLNMDFWNGEEHDIETATGLLREQPAIDRSERGRDE